KNLAKNILMLALLSFPTVNASGSDAAARGAAGTTATARDAGDGGQTRRRRTRQRVVRRTRKRGQRMSETKDDSRPRDSGESDDAAGQKKVGESQKPELPAPRPRRRYDPVLQPPEKTRKP
ncbi:MAG: hypothetical protein QOE47_2477, partial [Pyrinomonadaceae bacterium]|nr:hypothetical protein [Pyrinomonadaceae bacterium]